jgi:hypothetical protein
VIVTRDNVKAMARRPLTDEEWETAQSMLVPTLMETIEDYLGKCFGERDVEERLDVIGGMVYPAKHPILEIVSVTTQTGAAVGWYPWDREGIAVDTYERSLVVLYRAGELYIPPTLRQFVASAVAKTVLTPVQITTGMMSSYSVEGTSITFTAQTQGEGSVEGFTVAHLASLQRLRRLNFA